MTAAEVAALVKGALKQEEYRLPLPFDPRNYSITVHEGIPVGIQDEPLSVGFADVPQGAVFSAPIAGVYYWRPMTKGASDPNSYVDASIQDRSHRYLPNHQLNVFLGTKSLQNMMPGVKPWYGAGFPNSEANVAAGTSVFRLTTSEPDPLAKGEYQVIMTVTEVSGNAVWVRKAALLRKDGKFVYILPSSSQ